MPGQSGVVISYLVVNTNGRDHLLRCLAAVLAQGTGLADEILVCDNASTDGSAAAVRDVYGDAVRVIERGARVGKPENDNLLLAESRGEWCLLLNEDSELQPGATAALVAALEATPRAAVAGAQLLAPDGTPQPCAWRFPGVRSALLGALFLHRLWTVQSGGNASREVDWVQSSAMLVRRAAFEQMGGLDPAFFVYSDEVDWQRRLHDAGWSVLHVPDAKAIHHEQLSTDAEFSSRRIIEFARNRDLYVRKHDGKAAALVVRVLTAWAYLLRTLAALVLPGRSPRRFWAHVTAALAPGRGDGIREAAERFNAERNR